MTSTTAKGNLLEDQVFKLLPSLIANGSFPYHPDCCELHRKKSYYSKIREGNINFENVIEIYSKNNATDHNRQPTLVVVFECKNYSKLVEVSEVEEFAKKIDNIFGFRIKGYIVTRSGFQRGALNTAKNLGIGLSRILPDKQVQQILYQMSAGGYQKIIDEFPLRAIEGLTSPQYVTNYESVYCYYNDCVFRSIQEMLTYSIKIGEE